LSLRVLLARSEHFDAGDGNWTNTTLLFYSYLVEVGIFGEIIISRHFVGHTHEMVDGENSHIRAFVIGILKKCVGAALGLPSQLRQAFIGVGPRTMFNRNSVRCQYCEEVDYVFGFKEYLALRARTDSFLGGFLGVANANKAAESHEIKICRTTVDGQLSTVFSWRTKDDHNQMAHGKLPPDFWRVDETWPEGTPVFKRDASFNDGGPELSGFKPKWWADTKKRGHQSTTTTAPGSDSETTAPGSEEQPRPFRKAVEFVRENPNFANDSDWMSFYNPEWVNTGETCASKLQEWADKAPFDEETYLSQLVARGVQYKLPARWADLTPQNPPGQRRYRGYHAEIAAAVNDGDGGDADNDTAPIQLVQIVRQPARGNVPQGDAAVIRREMVHADAARSQRDEEAAEVRSDEPVHVGSFVFVVLAHEDRRGGFMQPFSLALVTQIEFATPTVSTADGEQGSVDHSDTLHVQYLTATGYDKMYAPAVMTDEDAATEKLVKNSVCAGVASRGQVAIANVVTNRNKVGGGAAVTFNKTAAFPLTFARGFVPAHHKCKLCGYTTMKSLRSHPGAMFEDHTGARRVRPQATAQSAVPRARTAPQQAASQQVAPQPRGPRAQRTRQLTSPQSRQSDPDYEEAEDEEAEESTYDSEEDELPLTMLARRITRSHR
jgi:hypothetical protein